MAVQAQTAADVIVIGSGVAGAVVAYELAKAGVSTLMLEAGPRLKRWEIVEAFRASPAKGDFQAPYAPSAHAPHPQYSPPNNYLIQKGPQPYVAGYIRAVGGTTWHWNAITWRYLPNDFKVRSLYGIGRDWPIDYATLEPYYLRAEVEMGVAGPSDTDFGSPRSQPYPMGPVPMSWLDVRVQQMLAGHGWHVTYDTVARNSRPYDNRPVCCGNNICTPICPIGAQYGGTDTVAKAEAAGARLIENAVVHRIELAAGGRVSAVHYLDPNGTSHRVTGRYFVLAANAIEIPKLMLMSSSDEIPRGVGNSSDLVGRNLMDHPGTAVTFLAADPLWPGRGPQREATILNLRDGAFRSEYSAVKINVGNYSQVRSVTEDLIERGVFGPDLDRQIRDRASRQASFTTLYEQLPDPANRVTLSPDQRDALGLPRPEITYSIEEYVREAATRTRAVFASFAEIMGGTDVRFSDAFSGNNHIMGTTIMGADPRDPVVDRDCRTHDHDNLYVASSSVFPSGAVVNSTLTITALAFRIADTIRGQL